MSQRVGGTVEEEKTLPPGAYFAQFVGFSRNKEGQVVLKDKTSTWTDKDSGRAVTQEVTKLYWQFMVVTGAQVGSEVAGSTPLKGVSIIATDSGPSPRFKAPGAYAPNFIDWLSACGLDFAKDLAGPIFETPLTNQTILDALEGILLEKSKGGHVVSLQVVELQEGVPWVSWDGGVMAAPAEVSQMMVPSPERPQRASPSKGPVTPAQAEHIRYLLALAKSVAAIDTAVLEATIRKQIQEWGVKEQRGVPVLSLLSTKQLQEIVDLVAGVLDSEGVGFEALAPAPEPEPEEEFVPEDDPPF